MTSQPSLSARGLEAAREEFKQARQELEYFGASEEFTCSPLEAAIGAYLDSLCFTDLMDIAQRLLDEHYQSDVMAAMADDPGPKLTLALRECVEAMSR